ncbi:alanine racemase [Pedomonas mirosovicensis]|uniref:alanine racemase n=1 Tax=Pedomonas mirosovicensis TaxID=2908641 RepID=UPI0021697A92|nr:alanine racemase [Pedomonas mirosovicensis]MCH8684949.1 alanine racemase [Pedomonas mirosovicensis]
MTMPPASRLRLSVDLDALGSNYRALARLAGPAACAAAVKAECYGLGLEQPARRLWAEGCRDFFVATLPEAAQLRALLPEARIHVLNGVLEGEVAAFRALSAQPVLNTPEQVALWRQAGGERPADLMLDTGMNRLGVRPEEVAGLDLSGLNLDIALSHFACADEPGHPLTRRQADRFAALSAGLPARRRSLANSAGIVEAPAALFDLARPGIALYGGVVHPALEGVLRPVAKAEAQVIQVKTVPAGETVGYNATWAAAAPTRLATLAIGYADGYLRGFSSRGQVVVRGVRCPVVGRVSMDLVTADISAVPAVQPGDWATLLGDGIPLAEAALWSGLSQYELLTLLGHRYERHYCAERPAVRETEAPHPEAPEHEARVTL